MDLEGRFGCCRAPTTRPMGASRREIRATSSITRRENMAEAKKAAAKKAAPAKAAAPAKKAAPAK